MRGLNGLQEALHDRLINAITSQGLTHFCRHLGVRLTTFIDRLRPIMQVAHTHATTTEPTQHNSLQECASLTRRASASYGMRIAIVSQNALMVTKLLPTNIGRMGIEDHNRPVLLFDATGISFDARSFSR